jgi:hypothetical protein
MKQWDGIRADTAETDDGVMFVNNANFFIDGELRRRTGMTGFPVTQSGTALSEYRNILTNRYVVFATSTGTVEAQVAT